MSGNNNKNKEMAAVALYKESDKPSSSLYYDKHSGMSPSSYHSALSLSSTLYVGNLSFFTNE